MVYALVTHRNDVRNVPGYREEQRDEILAVWDDIVLHCLLYFSLHKHPPFNCSDTALRVTEAIIGPKVKIFVFRHVCFVSRIWRQNWSPGSLTFFHLGNRAEIAHMNPRINFSPVNQAHLKEALKQAKLLSTQMRDVKCKTTSMCKEISSKRKLHFLRHTKN